MVGVLAGVGMSIGLREVFGAIGAELPDSPIVVSGRTVIAAAVVGIGVTLISAVFPARKASRVPPVAALRDGADAGAASHRLRMALGAALTIAGLAAGSAGLFVASTTTSIILLLASGAIGVFVGVTMLSPLVAVPLTRFVGWPLARAAGASGHLAKQNAGRNPQRTATTAAALMIGLAVVSMTLTVGESLKAQLGSTLDSSVRADYLAVQDIGDSFSAEAADRFTDTGLVDTITRFRYDRAVIDGDRQSMMATDLAATDVLFDLGISDGVGSDPAVTDPVLVSDEEAAAQGLAVGDTVPIVFESGERRDLTVTGVFDDDIVIDEHYVLDLSTWEAVGAEPGDTWLAFSLVDGVSTDEADAAFAPIARDYPQVDVSTARGFVEGIEDEIDQALARGQRHGGPGGDHRPDRHRQHPGPVGLRADPGAGPAPGGRHDPPPGPADDPPGGGPGRPVRGHPRGGARGAVRLGGRAGPARRRHQHTGRTGDLDRHPGGRGRPGRSRRRLGPGPPGRSAERPGRHRHLTNFSAPPLNPAEVRRIEHDNHAESSEPRVLGRSTSGQQGEQLGEVPAAGVVVVGVVVERVELHDLHAGGQGSGDVGVDGVADVQHPPRRGIESLQGRGEDGRIGLGHPLQRRVDDGRHRRQRPGPRPGRRRSPASARGRCRRCSTRSPSGVPAPASSWNEATFVVVDPAPGHPDRHPQLGQVLLGHAERLAVGRVVDLPEVRSVLGGRPGRVAEGPDPGVMGPAIGRQIVRAVDPQLAEAALDRLVVGIGGRRPPMSNTTASTVPGSKVTGPVWPTSEPLRQPLRSPVAGAARWSPGNRPAVGSGRSIWRRWPRRRPSNRSSPL